MDNIAEDFTPVNFTKIVPLRILPDGNCLYDAASMCFPGY